MRKLGSLVAVLALVGSLLAGSVTTRADEPSASWSHFRGRVVVSDYVIAPAASFPSPAAMVAALRRLERATIEASAGFWRLHLYAFLDRVPDSASLQLLATDITDARAPREVRAFDIKAVEGEKELPLGDFVLTEAMGFVKGHRYEIAVARGRDETGAPENDKDKAKGKADVYAKGVITLK
jgi:hypothetical protein